MNLVSYTNQARQIDAKKTRAIALRVMFAEIVLYQLTPSRTYGHSVK